MRIALAALLVAPTLTACAGASCRDYYDAYNACYQEYTDATGGSDYSELEGDYCSVYDNPLLGPALAVAGANWACQAAAFRDGDCSTLEGFSAASSAAGACN